LDEDQLMDGKELTASEFSDLEFEVKTKMVNGEEFLIVA
jgi:hypothetical protein